MSMSPSYIPEPYAEIIKRLGNAYDTGFFVNGAYLFLAAILKEAAEQESHSATIWLGLGDGSRLDHAFIEITVGEHVFDLDIKGRGARSRAQDDLTPLEKCRDRKPNEDWQSFVHSFYQRDDINHPLESFAGGNDNSKSFGFVRRLGFDYA